MNMNTVNLNIKAQTNMNKANKQDKKALGEGYGQA